MYPPIALLAGLLVIGGIIYQWLREEVSLELWGPLRLVYSRDEAPVQYWIVLLLELAFAGFCFYTFFATY